MESEPSNEVEVVPAVSGSNPQDNNNSEAPEGMPAGFVSETSVVPAAELTKLPDPSTEITTAINNPPSDVTSIPASEAPEGLVDVKLTALGVVGSIFQEVRSSAKVVETAIASSTPTPSTGLTLRLAPVSSDLSASPVVTSSPVTVIGEQTTNPMNVTSRASPVHPLRRTFSGRLRHCFNLWGRK
jgi:hypothetical protein